MKPPPNHQGTSISMFWFRNGPIWEILWNTGNAVSLEAFQSGKFYGIRETLSVQKRSTLGNFMEYGKRCQFRSGSIWEILWHTGNAVSSEMVQSWNVLGPACLLFGTFSGGLTRGSPGRERFWYDFLKVANDTKQVVADDRPTRQRQQVTRRTP